MVSNVFTGGDLRVFLVNARSICNHMCLYNIHVTALCSFENVALVCDPGSGSGRVTSAHGCSD